MKRPARILPDLASRLRHLPWLSLAGLAMALFAQFLLEPSARPLPAFVIYLSAMGFIAWAIWAGEWGLASLPETTEGAGIFRIHLPPAVLSFVSLAAAFFFFGGNLFTPLNLTLWLVGLTLLVYSLWIREPRQSPGRKMDWEWLGLLAAVLLLSGFLSVLSPERSVRRTVQRPCREDPRSG